MAKRTLLLFLLAGLVLALAFAGGCSFALATERSRLDRNKALVRRMHASFWSEPDRQNAAKAVRELYSPHFAVHDWTGDHALETEGLMANWEFERSAFKGLEEHLDAIIS